MAYKDLTGARMDECPPYQFSPYHTQLQTKGVAWKSPFISNLVCEMGKYFSN